MGFEEKQEKKEGEEELNQEQIQGIAVAVKGLIDQDKEKGKTTQDLGVIRSEVGELKGQLAQVQKALYCTEDGKICFNTPEELSAFMERQEKIIQGLDGKVTEVVEKIRGLDEGAKKPTFPPGVQRLLNVTPEIRAAMSKEDNEARDAGLKAIANYFNTSLNDLWRLIERDSISLDNIAKKGNMRKRVLDGITDQELKDVTLMACRDGKCKPFREGMEKSAGIKFYAKDKRGRFQPVDQEEKEGPHI